MNINDRRVGTLLNPFAWFSSTTPTTTSTDEQSQSQQSQHLYHAEAAPTNEATLLCPSPKETAYQPMTTADMGMDSEARRRSHKNWMHLIAHVATGQTLLESKDGPTHVLEDNLDNIDYHTHYPHNNCNPHHDDRHAMERKMINKSKRPLSPRESFLVRRERAMGNIRNQMKFSVGQCALAFGVYICLAVIAFSFVLEEHWSIIDSVYFSVSTFSSVGYGDISPTSGAGRIFTSVFALSGVACLGIALGVVGNRVLDAQKAALDQAAVLSELHVGTLFDLFPSERNKKNKKRSSVPTEEESPLDQSCTNDCNNRESVCAQLEDLNVAVTPQSMQVLYELGLVLVVLLAFALLIVAVDPNIHAADVVYFLIITSTTCGFGDIAPTSQAGRLVTALLIIPVAVGAMGRWLSLVATWIMDMQSRHAREQMQFKDLTHEDLEVMDEDGDGNVTRAEFLEFMLLAMDKVDRTLLNELRTQFAHLDTDNTGVLSRQDLIVIARKSLQCPARKLELSRYKKKLFHQMYHNRNNDHADRNSRFS